uniref:Uma2 family endonuclease n=1 Tax=Petrachloros mirabilis TaxID=2918835 RepID=UPI001EE92B20|nr:Uma2 family endonuclease [Petrachloros mirabilis]
MTHSVSQNYHSAQPKRFTVQEYHRLAESGFLTEDDHVELIRGELIQMAAKGTAHETCITRLRPQSWLTHSRKQSTSWRSLSSTL